MTIPTIYRGTPSQILSTADFFDAISGKGIKILYGGAIDQINNSTTGGLQQGRNYILNGTSFFSNPSITQNSVNNGGSFLKTVSCAFVGKFGNAFIVEGDTFINIPIGQSNSTGGTQSIFASYALVLTSGSTITSLASASGALMSQGQGAFFEKASFKANLTRTKIKKNDTITLYAEVWSNSNVATTVMMGHDSKTNYDGGIWTSSASTDTLLQVGLPIVIQ